MALSDAHSKPLHRTARPRTSRSCANCRAIKRRCDQQLPQCGQCVRQRESCPGYRDEWELIFRDQTRQTIKRSKRKASRTVDNGDAIPDHGLPSCRMEPSNEEIGVNYFLTHFISGGRACSRGCLNYIPYAYCADVEHPTVVTSMAAVGLVALANSTKQPRLAAHANAKYAEAIRRVNASLASPTESTSDSTLMAVISLSVFEEVSGYRSWLLHVQGAAALVVARGKKQFSSPMSSRLFNQVRTDLITSCFNDDYSMPEEFIRLEEQASKEMEPCGLFWLIGRLGTRCARLLTAVRRNNGETPWSELLSDSIELISDLDSLSAALLRDEPYTSFQASGQILNVLPNGRVHIYRDAFSIRVWNNWRNLLMVVFRVQCYVLQKLMAAESSPATLQALKTKFQHTMTRLSNLGDDILATMPQAMGFLSLPSDGELNLSPYPDYSNVPGAYMMASRLSVVGQSPATKSETRQWIIQRLRDIGRNNRLLHAMRIAEVLEEVR